MAGTLCALALTIQSFLIDKNEDSINYGLIFSRVGTRVTMYQIPKTATDIKANLTKRFSNTMIAAKAVNIDIDESAKNLALLGIPRPLR